MFHISIFYDKSTSVYFILKYQASLIMTLSPKDHFILHWLDRSRSQRILWLLEILELNYEVEVYLRDSRMRAPDALKAVHPSGKSPVLEIRYADGLPTKKLVESGFIIQHLIRHYDVKNVLTPEDPNEQENVDYYLHYAEGTLQPLLVSLLINSVAVRQAPFGIKTLMKVVTNGLNSAYYATEWKMNMDYLENQLKNENTGYFVGKQLSGADIILSFPIYEKIFGNEIEAEKFIGKDMNFAKSWPHLHSWSKMIADDPIYIKVGAKMKELVGQKTS